ncbi:glycosyltransferase family 2 protein [Candidatus Zixiibacteriota bacterium]
MEKLSVVIITKDEEKNISRTLESVTWADEIVLVDSQSSDRTVEIAESFGVKIYSPPWRGYGPAKKEGVNRASHRWILSIDADEVVTTELKEEIKSILESEKPEVGYYLPRMTNFLGKWIKHSGWYPDYVLRLFNKDFGNFNENVVHEAVIVSGTTGQLKNDLLHYSYPNLEEYFNKYNRYTTIGAEELYKKGKKSSIFEIVFKPFIAFIKHFIIKAGFLDGVEGFLVSFLSATAVMVKYAKLRRLYNMNGMNKQNE